VKYEENPSKGQPCDKKKEKGKKNTLSKKSEETKEGMQ